MSNRRYFVLVFLLLVGIGGSLALGQLGNPFASTGYLDLARPLTSFPMKVGRFTGMNVPLSPHARALLKVDHYLRRQFSGPSGRKVLLFVAYYGNERRGLETIYHNPTVCFPAAGWKSAKTEQRKVTLKDASNSRRRTVTLDDAARSVGVSLDTFEREGQEVVVLNFFVVNGEILPQPPRNKPFWLGLQKLHPSAGPGYFAQIQIAAEDRKGTDRAAETTVRFLKLVGRRILLCFPS